MKKSAIHSKITLLALAWLVGCAAITAAGAEPPTIAACQQAVKLKPDDAEAWFNLGLAHWKAGSWADDAITAFQQAIRWKPDHVLAWHNLGVVYQECRRTEDATNAFHQAVKLKPDAVEARQSLANVGTETIHDLMKRGCGARQALASSNQEPGKKAEAGGAFQKAQELSAAPAKAELPPPAAQSAIREDEIAALRHAIKLKPNDPAAWVSLGFAYEQSGGIKDAIAAYQRAVKVKPDDADAWSALGYAYQKAGRTAESQVAFQKYRELDPSLFR